MSRLEDLEVGARVQVFWVNGNHGGGNMPKTGYDGTVTAVGRKLLTVKSPMGTKKFRIDTGGYNSKDWGLHYWIMTPEQAAEHIHRSDLLEALRTAGVDFRPYAKPSVRQLEGVLHVLTHDQWTLALHGGREVDPLAPDFVTGGAR